MAMTIADLLARSRTIAVVGMSADPHKAAHRIPLELAAAGYDVVPINPNHREILGLACRSSLEELTDPVDIVNVFRPPRDCPPIATAAVRLGAYALWLQLGIVSPEARSIAEGGGLTFVEDRCIAVERRRYDVRPT